MNLNLDSYEDEPYFIPRKTLKTNKFKKERDDMGRPHTDAKRSAKKPAAGNISVGTTPNLGKAKQYATKTVKAGGPNYPDKSVTGVFQDGRKG